jgi:hypothetical protein
MALAELLVPGALTIFGLVPLTRAQWFETRFWSRWRRPNDKYSQRTEFDLMAHRLIGGFFVLIGIVSITQIIFF